jgi:hypothetical protein
MILKVERNSPRAFPHRALLSAALLFLLALPALTLAQDLARRLILKDGSYQLVTKYEVKGDRVRYMSAERDDWEELPSSLIDWPATEKYERDRAAGSSVPEAAQLDKEIEQERDRAEALLPEVAPGLRLPEDSGVFLLDSFQGEPQIVELQQTAGEVSHHTKGNIFRDAMNPVAGLKVAIELEGAHAPLQAHGDVPSIYIKVDAAPDPSDQASPKSSNSSPPGAQQPQQARLPLDRFRLVRTEVKSGKRVVGDVKPQPPGKNVADQHLVRTTVSRVNGGWLKLTPTEGLPPGEYVLIQMTGQQDGIGKEGFNLFVWDFGVNPKAPANANPWKPDAPGTKPESDSKPN